MFLPVIVFIGLGCISSGYVRPPGVCLDSFYAIQGHTMCIANNQQRPIHEDEKNEIIRAHESVREAVSPKASDMLSLEYMSPLEKEAQIWAEQCRLDHDEVDLRVMPGRYVVGQNILVSPSQLTWQQVVDEWAKEKVIFQYGHTNDIKLVGNYTQMVSSETTTVGCGMAPCGGVYFYVCNYAPSDLASRVAHPYKESASGQGTDDCPNHVSNTSTSLCDCGGILCLNGGKVNLTACTCDCPPDDTGKRYDPKYCELMCEPPTDPDYCLTKNETECKTDTDTFILCPWKCKACPYAGVNYKQGSATMPWTTTVLTTLTTASTSMPVDGASTASAQHNSATPSLTSAVTQTRGSATTQAPSGSGLAHSQKRDNGGTRAYLDCFNLIVVLLVSVIGWT